MTHEEFLNLIIPLAVESEKKYQIPAEIVTAQAILESNWGQSRLALKGKNLFGIKASGSWKGEVMILTGYEFVNGRRSYSQMKWRKYQSWQDSLDDHARFFHENPRYKRALETRSWQEFAYEIAKAGYATDPQYVNKLVTLVQRYYIQLRCHNIRYPYTSTQTKSASMPRSGLTWRDCFDAALVMMLSTFLMGVIFYL